MNVLKITNDLNVLREGSPARAQIEKEATLAKHVVVIVLNTNRNRYPVQKASDGLLILPTNSYFSALSIWRALYLIRRELFFQGHLQVDLVEARDPGFSGFIGWIVSIRFHRPLLLNLPFNILPRGYGNQSLAHAGRLLLARFLVRRSQAITITSEGTRAALADISTAIADRALLVPHFMDIESFQKEPVRIDLAAKYPQFKFIILMVAPLETSSNVQLAITILAGVVRLYPDVGLIIVGEGSLEGKLRSYAKKIKMQDHVVFERLNENISSYYKSARIFMITAPYEEFGDSLAMAAAASCAILTTKVGIASAIIEDGVSGFLCEANDAARYVASIILMIRKPATCDSLRLNANLSIQKYMDSDEAAYLNFAKESWEKAVAMAAQSLQS
jgi:glycosyltransferase involved in cell wall biosynthesis